MTPPASTLSSTVAHIRRGRGSKQQRNPSSSDQDQESRDQETEESFHRPQEIRIPGSFVVLHGSAGDGMRNTMDSVPDPRGVFDDTDDDSSVMITADESFEHIDDVRMHEVDTSASSNPPGSAGSPPLPPLGGVVASSTSASARRNEGALPSLNHPILGTSSSFTTASSNRRKNSRERQQSATSSRVNEDDPFVVVTENHEASSTNPDARASRTHTKNKSSRNSSSYDEAIKEWTANGRARELRQRHDWLQQAGIAPETQTLWWQAPETGQLAVFRGLPTRLKSQPKILTQVIGSLHPGSTIVSTKLVTLDSSTLEPISSSLVSPTLFVSKDDPSSATTSRENDDPLNSSIYPQGRPGWIQLLQIEYLGRTGYCVLSLDGYPFLVPGLPSSYVDPKVWMWRVTCPVGAVVREGLELNSRHLETLPYGSLIRVTQKTINSMGLSRLRISSVVEEPPTATSDGITSAQNGNDISPLPHLVDGWCSEFLNPLSGQRGMVAQPISFSVPALYRVTLPVGAVVREDVELSSRQVGTIPYNSIIVIVARAFSEHPMDKCLERLQLAGDGGWISVRLNRPPPEDDVVVELVGTDGTFDPESPGEFHLDATQKVQASEFLPPSPQEQAMAAGNMQEHQQNNNHEADLSSVDEENELTTPASATSGRHGPVDRLNDKCLICLTENRNATLVHGETGHVACCLICARILKARGDSCPVCRLPIQLVIQHFWA